MDIIDLHPLDREILEMGDLDVGGVLDPAGTGERPAPDGKV